MRKLLFATTALSMIAFGAAQAQEAPVQSPNAPAADSATSTDAMTTTSTSNEVGAGITVGGAAGAATGALVGGPVGAVVGGFAGAMLGTAAAVPEPAVDYVVAHPVDPVVIDGGVSAGAQLPEAVALTPIPEHPDYAYVYADGRPVIVKMDNREVVYSPGYVVPEQTVSYVRGHPHDPVAIDAGLSVGAVVPGDIELVEIPNDPAYAYVYTDSGPVLVNTGTRTVVWVQGS